MRLYLRLLPAVLWLVFVACGAAGAEPISPSPTSTEPSATKPAATQTEEASPTAPAATETPGPTFDPSVPPGVLVIDYGPREGWDSGGPGAARGALVGLDAATGEELDWWEPTNTGHHSTRTPSPDGRFVVFAGSYDFILETATGARRPMPDGVPDFFNASWAADWTTVYGTFERSEPWKTQNNGGHHVLGTDFWAVDAVSGDARVVAEAEFQVQALRVGPGGHALYVLAFRSEQCCGIDVEGDAFVAVVDVETGVVRGEIALPGVVVGQRFEERGQEGAEMNILRRPGVALAPDGSGLYIAHADDDRVTIVDLERMEVVGTAVPERSKSVLGRLKSWAGGLFVSEARAKGGAYFTKEAAVSPDGRWLYITGSGAEICETDEWFPCVEWAPMGLRIIDASSMALVVEFEGIGHMMLTPDGGHIVGWGLAYDSRGSGDTVEKMRYGPFVVDTASQELIGQVEPPAAGSGGMAISPDGRYGYTVEVEPEYGSESLLTVIDLETASVVAQRAYSASYLSLVSLVAGP